VASPPKCKYTPEFRAEAVKLVESGAVSQAGFPFRVGRAVGGYVPRSLLSAMDRPSTSASLIALIAFSSTAAPSAAGGVRRAYPALGATERDVILHFAHRWILVSITAHEAKVPSRNFCKMNESMRASAS
jgi:hypothetical protein